MPVALVTGASTGLGLALARALVRRGWNLVIDARGAERLERAAEDLRSLISPEPRSPGAAVVAVPGDVGDEAHRRELIGAVARQGRLDLLVNNASHLGPSPQPRLEAYPLAELRRVYEIDVLAPLALIQAALPLLSPGGIVINVSSDAAVEAYDGWGGYGSAKSALDRLSAVLGVEHPALAVYAIDPGDMRTEMHQAAFPGEDISDRPEPETVVPALLHLIDSRPPSGRLRAADLVPGPGIE